MVTRNPAHSTTLLLLAVVAAAGSCADSGSQGSAGPATDAVKHGEYLVNTSACHDCHTPMKMGAQGPEPDMARMLSGHPETLMVATAPDFSGAAGGPEGSGPWTWAGTMTNTAFAGPWGISYAANLTPEPNTGLGIWTEDMFVRALRTGQHMGQSRPIAPPMPWPSYRHFTDADLKAIYAYLKSVPPITNHVPDYRPPVVQTTASAKEQAR